MKFNLRLGKNLGFNFAAFGAGNYNSTSSLYEGAGDAKHRTSISGIAQDSRKDVPRWSRIKLLAKSRALYANDGLARGAINDIARYSVGGGLIPQAQTDDVAWNEAAEAYWREWCKVADVTGRFHFNRLQRILSIAIDRDGDVGLLLVKGASGFPQVQVVESHRIGDGTDNNGVQGDGSEWFDGVRVNKAGRPLEYRIVTMNVMGIKKVEVIPADNFVMLFDGERADMVRGIPALYHAINTIHDRKDILDNEKIGQKKDAQTWAILKTKSGEADPADWTDEEVTVDGKKLTFTESRGGETKVVATDEDLTPWQSNRPSPAFNGFLDHLIRDVATGLGVPYEFVWNPERLGGTAQRFILEKAQRRFRERQDLLETMVLNRLWFWVISVAIQRGDLKTVKDGWRVRWQRPSELTVDAGRDANNDREDVKMGLMTEAEHFGRRGMDWQEARTQKEREVDDLLERAGRLAKKHGLPLMQAMQMLQLSTPNANMAGQPTGKNSL